MIPMICLGTVFWNYLLSLSPCSEIVDIDVIEKDGFFDILYALNDPGDYDINVKFGGKDIPNGSFSIKVA